MELSAKEDRRNRRCTACRGRAKPSDPEDLTHQKMQLERKRVQAETQSPERNHLPGVGSTRRLELESPRSCLNAHHLVSKNSSTQIGFPEALVLGGVGAGRSRGGSGEAPIQIWLNPAAFTGHRQCLRMLPPHSPLNNLRKPGNKTRPSHPVAQLPKIPRPSDLDQNPGRGTPGSQSPASEEGRPLFNRKRLWTRSRPGLS